MHDKDRNLSSVVYGTEHTATDANTLQQATAHYSTLLNTQDKDRNLFSVVYGTEHTATD